jgi:hypothetical protein
MSAVLREDQKLRRTIKVYGVTGSVIVTLTHGGIEFKMPRTKMGVGMSWKKAVDSCYTPENVPSKFEGRPMEFLISQSVEAEKRRVKKAQNA